MGNLNELHVPDGADEAADFAARREFGLRYDSYREGLVREAGLREMSATILTRWQEFRCPDPEQAWIDMLSDAGHSVKA